MRLSDILGDRHHMGSESITITCLSCPSCKTLNKSPGIPERQNVMTENHHRQITRKAVNSSQENGAEVLNKKGVFLCPDSLPTTV